MRALLAGEVNDRLQAVIDIGVFGKKPSRAEAENPAPQNRFRALIDTGANGTAVSREVAERLGLESKGAADIGTTGGMRRSRIYDIALAIPMRRGFFRPRPWTLIVPDLLARQHFMPGGRYDVLLGMDVIVKCSLCFRARKFALKHA